MWAFTSPAATRRSSSGTVTSASSGITATVSAVGCWTVVAAGLADVAAHDDKAPAITNEKAARVVLACTLFGSEKAIIDAPAQRSFERCPSCSAWRENCRAPDPQCSGYR